jgi:hypothetical protein
MKYLFLFFLSFPLALAAQSDTTELRGAWRTTYPGPDDSHNTLTMTIADGYFVMTAFNELDGTFLATLGGSYEADEDSFNVTYEFDSSDSANVGQTKEIPYILSGNLLLFNGDKAWTRVDAGDSDLTGAWVITGRRVDGELREMGDRGPRKTMKILSGDRFQWIAYNTETAEMNGTGGGTFSTVSDTYTETIQFFSRDASRVGAELSFNYQLKDGNWHHSGRSSKGDPIYEVWSPRE